MTTPAIFMIHGMWSTPEVFDGLRTRLTAAGHTVHTPVLPFHELSPDAPANFELGQIGVADYIDFLVAEIAKLPEVPIIGGHSMGGFLAQAVAARVEAPGLMLFSPAATASTNVLAIDPLRTLSHVMTRGSWWKSPTKIDAEHARWGIYNGLPADVADAEIAKLVWDSGRVLFEMGLPWLAKTTATRVDYTRLRMPALVIVGAADRITVPAIARATARAIVGAVDYHELPDTGHWLWHGGTGDRVADLALGWLRAQFSGGANLASA